jgi:hypothetical protein
MKFIAFITCILSGSALAGWSSGGGEIPSVHNNPWFAFNSTDVAYCVRIEEQHFGASRTEIDAAIKAGFFFWQTQLKAHGGFYDSGVEVILGEQAFREVPCGSSESITFQFGVLTSEQAQYLKDPSRVVATAVQTAYDSVNLRGSGFIYVSPESGPYALIDNGSEGGILPNRWRHANGKLLEIALAHEIGHVFGIAHLQRGIMDAQALSEVIRRNNAAEMPEGFIVPPMFFKTDDDTGYTPVLTTEVYCSPETSDASLIKFLGGPESHKWLKITMLTGGKMGVFAATDKNLPYEEIGTLVPNGEYEGHGSSVITFDLPPTQRVYDQTHSGKTLKLDFFSSATMAMQYTTRDNNLKREILLTMEPDRITLGGVLPSGKISLYLGDFATNFRHTESVENSPVARKFAHRKN